MDILSINEAPMRDDSIEKYVRRVYKPTTGENLNKGVIRIDIGNKDMYIHPSESYLLFEGRLTKADGSAYADDDNVTLTNNAIMHLFSNIKYDISGKEIESLNYPGQATTMLGLLNHTDDFAKSRGLTQLWYKDSSEAAAPTNTGFAVRQSYIIKGPNLKGTFRCVVPLKHIFGFCDDYDKVIYGMDHTLTLVRKSDDDAIFRADDVDAGKITLNTIHWSMPIVTPAAMEKLQLLKTIEARSTLPVSYRKRNCEIITLSEFTKHSWRLPTQSSPERPRYVIVGFQTDKSDDQEKNPSIFNNLNMKNIYVKVNNDRQPEEDYDLDFANNKFVNAYFDADEFKSKFYGIESLLYTSNITPADYKTLFPLFVFDVSKQSEKLKQTTTDIYVEMDFMNNVPPRTRAFAVVISDNMLNFQSDGNKLSVVR